MTPLVLILLIIFGLIIDWKNRWGIFKKSEFTGVLDRVDSWDWHVYYFDKKGEQVIIPLNYYDILDLIHDKDGGDYECDLDGEAVLFGIDNGEAYIKKFLHRKDDLDL